MCVCVCVCARARVCVRVRVCTCLHSPAPHHTSRPCESSTSPPVGLVVLEVLVGLGALEVLAVR
jgi:hypothetical protein